MQGCEPGSPTPTLRIRAFQPADRDGIRAICAATAWKGGPAPEHFGDGWIWAEIWTRYFTDAEPQHTWVVEDTRDGRVLGYLTGTTDASRCDRYLLRLIPGIVWHAIASAMLRHRPQRRLLAGLLRSFLRGELDIPPEIRRTCPATLHLDLLPEARGQGLGKTLMSLFLDRMRELGVPGVHGQTLSNNVQVARLNQRAGFYVVATRPLRAFRSIIPDPLSVQTWARSL